MISPEGSVMSTTAGRAEADAVVVGVDGSSAALDAVRWAAARARSLHRPLTLLHATIWPLMTHPAPPTVPAHYQSVMVEAARGWLDGARENAEYVAPGLPIHEQLSTGDPRPVLLAESARAREIVVGSRGLGGFTGMLVGSVATALTQHAQCPVVVVRAEGDPHGPVVVGVDGSPTGERALGYAFDAASRMQAPLVALHTWSDVGVGELWGPPPDLLDWESIGQNEQCLLAERLAGWGEKYPDVTVRQLVQRDRPAHALAEAGRRARLLVVGARGRGGFTGMLLGSTSRFLVHHATCPLAVVRS
ncbi:MAG: universal stress protein [Pseudonocardiaceae bacterium]